jgi:hypothetical protein
LTKLFPMAALIRTSQSMRGSITAWCAPYGNHLQVWYYSVVTGSRVQFGNLMETHWELEGNMLGTQEKWKYSPPPPPPQT